MAETGTDRPTVSTAGAPSSLIEQVRLASRLLPGQLKDELQLATTQLKAKGIKAGVAAALAAGALVFVSLMVVALLVAAIMGLATVMPAWLAALLVAALFLLLAGTLALVAVSRFKRAQPLLPQDALRGLRHDLGVIREGSSFDPASLDVEKPAKQAKPAGEAARPEPVPYGELLRRSAVRRDQLALLRDDLGAKLDLKAQARHGLHRASTAAEAGFDRVAATLGPAGQNAGKALRERWQPLAVMAASLAALVVFLRRLLRP
ncbi:hypothetical protein NCCP1664_10770 [Zafaria cholistanensis]|uniref:Phage holin family protein n=1 Tax=Zafaria cholistanensis TaxID=1682741 RepID=A0A5A7NP62_9MICC|nr:phage holin family protein [Zafaria cholistanensis]GER22580.1 hypothetical protein NCCP1664_10770 [Zafaria cholistanensis]